MQVATLKDPASARLGESLYTFLPRSVYGNLKDGIMMELERLNVRGVPFFSLQNRSDTAILLACFSLSKLASTTDKRQGLPI